MPVEFFRQFLPAVQRQTVTLCEQNIEAMKLLARDWEVPSLEEHCHRWESSPVIVLTRLLDASHEKVPERLPHLIRIVASRIDEFLKLEKFMLIPPQCLNEILGHADCRVSDQRELFKVMMAYVTLRNPKCSSLLNHLSVESLSDQDMELLIANNRVDKAQIAPFYAHCVLRFLMRNRSTQREIEQKEREKRRLERDRGAKQSDLERLQQKLDSEKQRHGDCVRQLNAMYDRYEPAHPLASAAPRPQQHHARRPEDRPAVPPAPPPIPSTPRVFGDPGVPTHPKVQVCFEAAAPAQPSITVEKPMSRMPGMTPPLVIVRAARATARSSGAGS
jgi:hypothetical protein